MSALPCTYAITGEAGNPAEWTERFERLLQRAPGMVQLRARSLPVDALAQRAAAAASTCRAAGIPLLLNGPVTLVRTLGLDGLHLDSATLMSLTERPVSRRRWVGASCHNAAELAQAAAIGADFACLSPVRRTGSHPQAEPLGWDGFQVLVEKTALPVFALGGVGPADLERCRAAGGYGVAGISAFGW